MKTSRIALSLPLAALLVAGCAQAGPQAVQSPALGAPASAAATPTAQEETAPGAESPAGSMGEMTGVGGMAKEDGHLHTIGDGTAAQAGPLTLSVTQVPAAGSEGTLGLVVSRDDAPVTDFAIAHEKPMHLLLVSGDLSTMLHVHPKPSADGTWQVPVKFPFGGTWRVVPDVAVSGPEGDQHYVMGAAVDVAGAPAPAFTAPEPAASTSVDGFDIALSGDVSGTEHGMLMATITRDGKAVELEPWLGADGHLVGFREEDSAYAHMHSGQHDHGAADKAAAGEDGHGDEGHGDEGHGDEGHTTMPGMLHFGTEFPGTGRYRMFLQFQVDGTVHTATFTLDAL